MSRSFKFLISGIISLFLLTSLYVMIRYDTSKTKYLCTTVGQDKNGPLFGEFKNDYDKVRLEITPIQYEQIIPFHFYEIVYKDGRLIEIK
jgi:hypothetical protein